MVNHPKAVPPPGPGNEPDPLKGVDKKQKPTGSFQFEEGKEWLGMNFSKKQWNQLMNNMLQNLNDYIRNTFQKMTAKMKKDWQRGMGKDVD